MKNKIMMVGILTVLLLLPLVSADTEYVFKKDNEIDLKVNCFENNLTLCSATTNCYITVNYPDTTNLINNGTMSNSVTYYNYTIAASKVNQVGEYNTLVYCEGTDEGYTVFTFEVNKEGSRLQSYIFLTLILIFLYFIMIFGAMQEEIVFTSIAAMALVVLGIYIHMNGYGDVKSWISDTFGFINIIIGAYVFIRIWGEEAVNQLGN